MARLYDTARWKRQRLHYLAEHPLCVLCQRNEQVRSATVVDHINPYKGNANLFWDQNNWQAVCKQHHDHKTSTQDNEGSFGYQRIPTFITRPPVIPVHIVCGPPGSGKTTYAERHRDSNSVLIDLDYIAADLSGQPLHKVDMDQWLAPSMKERNHRIAQLTKPQAKRYSSAWFVVSAPRLSDRRQWRDIMHPEQVIVLETAADKCYETMQRRLGFDGSPSVYHAISRWWKQYTQDTFNDRVVVTG